MMQKLTIIFIQAVRKDYARRSEEASREWKDRMARAEQNLEDNEETHRAVGAGMVQLFEYMCHTLACSHQKFSVEFIKLESKPVLYI
jgi:hypothetical protein